MSFQVSKTNDTLPYGIARSLEVNDLFDQICEIETDKTKATEILIKEINTEIRKFFSQSKGAEDYLKDKMGSGKRFEPNSYAKLKDFKNAAMDVLSESEITSLFPKDVWESAANRYLSNVWKKSSKAK